MSIFMVLRTHALLSPTKNKRQSTIKNDHDMVKYNSIAEHLYLILDFLYKAKCKVFSDNIYFKRENRVLIFA